MAWARLKASSGADTGLSSQSGVDTKILKSASASSRIVTDSNPLKPEEVSIGSHKRRVYHTLGPLATSDVVASTRDAIEDGCQRTTIVMGSQKWINEQDYPCGDCVASGSCEPDADTAGEVREAFRLAPKAKGGWMGAGSSRAFDVLPLSVLDDLSCSGVQYLKESHCIVFGVRDSNSCVAKALDKARECFS